MTLEAQHSIDKMSQKPPVGCTGKLIFVQIIIKKLSGKGFTCVNLIQDVEGQMAN